MAFITLTVETHPVVLIVSDSVGRRVLPQVSTSAGSSELAALMRVSTNLNAEGVVQEPDVDGKLTFRPIPGGRIGEEVLKGVERSTLVTFVLRAAYTSAAVVLEEEVERVV